jgi:hypothetical protein
MTRAACYSTPVSAKARRLLAAQRTASVRNASHTLHNVQNAAVSFRLNSVGTAQATASLQYHGSLPPASAISSL